MILVSACLAGVPCRYDGEAKPCSKVIQWVKEGKAIPLCPEQLAGLPTPRPSAEQLNGRVVTQEGNDLTEFFRQGAKQVLTIALALGCDEAVLKSKSPSCGCGKVYDGTFTGTLVKGDGVLTQMLKKNGVAVSTEENV